MPENEDIKEEAKTDSETEKETEKPEGENLEKPKTETAQTESVSERNEEQKPDGEEKPEEENKQDDFESRTERLSLAKLYFYFTMNNLKFISPVVFNKCVSIGNLSLGLIKLLNMPIDDETVLACYFSNIGLAAIPHNIYHSNSLLDESSMQVIRNHVNSSYNILSRYFPKAADIVLNHHELPMGKGYLKKPDSEVKKESYVIGIAERFLGSTSVLRSLIKPQSSFMDAANNALKFYEGTTHIFSEKELEAVFGYLYQADGAVDNVLENAFNDVTEAQNV